jgi:uncharacterized membrane protein
MRYLLVLLALAGAVISILALRIHYMDPNAAPPCAVSAHWDCGTVNHSKYSVFPPIGFDEKPGTRHVPVATVGLVGYVVIGLFAGFGKFGVVRELAEIGFFCALMLSFIEAFILQTWCIYCVWSQTIIAVLLAASIVAVVLDRRRRRVVLAPPPQAT